MKTLTGILGKSKSWCFSRNQKYSVGRTFRIWKTVESYADEKKAWSFGEKRVWTSRLVKIKIIFWHFDVSNFPTKGTNWKFFQKENSLVQEVVDLELLNRKEESIAEGAWVWLSKTWTLRAFFVPFGLSIFQSKEQQQLVIYRIKRRQHVKNSPEILLESIKTINEVKHNFDVTELAVLFEHFGIFDLSNFE